MEPIIAGIFGLFALVYLGVGFYNMGLAIYHIADHSKWQENAVPDPGARIIDIKSEKVKYIKNDARFKTTVTFSDGFFFTTHKTDRENHFGSYTISVNKKVVLEAAIQAHAKAVEKKLRGAPAPKPAVTAPQQPEPKPQPPVAAPPEDDYPTTVPAAQTKPSTPADDYPVTTPLSETGSPVPEDLPVTTPMAEPETTRWVCPKCGLVHNKALAVCFHCGTEQKVATKFV